MACDITHTENNFLQCNGVKKLSNSWDTHRRLPSTRDCENRERRMKERKKERGETNMEKRTEAQRQIGMLRVKHGHD